MKNPSPGESNMISQKEEDYLDSYSEAKKHVAKPEHHLDLYNSYFSEYVDKREGGIALLELGVLDGYSLEYFSHLLKNSIVCGINRKNCERKFSSANIKFYQGLEDDTELHERIMWENSIQAFDIIIDDCSHIGSLTMHSYKALFPFLKPGGLYVIENWGTGYWPEWPDGHFLNTNNHMTVSEILARSMALVSNPGRRFPEEQFKSHSFGIPGFLKQLVDEVGMTDATTTRGLGTYVPSTLAYMHVYHGIVFLKKAAT